MAPSLLDALAKSYRELVEENRKLEETQRNERRWDAYNKKRIKAGLKPLSWVAWVDQKHGLSVKVDRVQQLAAENTQPEHRDNVVLLNR